MGLRAPPPLILTQRHHWHMVQSLAREFCKRGNKAPMVAVALAER